MKFNNIPAVTVSSGPFTRGNDAKRRPVGENTRRVAAGMEDMLLVCWRRSGGVLLCFVLAEKFKKMVAAAVFKSYMNLYIYIYI